MSESTVKKSIDKQKKKGIKKSLVFIFILLILFLLAFLAIYFNIFGAKDLIEKKVKLPFLSSSKTTQDDKIKKLESDVSLLKKVNKELEDINKEKDNKLIILQKQIEALTSEISKYKSQQESREAKVKEYANYLANMNPRKAAPIMESLVNADIDLAKDILKSIPSDIASQILSNIATDKTIKLISEQNTKSKQNINGDIYKIYENIEDDVAAAVFDNMVSNKNNIKLISQILINISKDKAARILGKMKAENAAVLTQDIAVTQ